MPPGRSTPWNTGAAPVSKKPKPKPKPTTTDTAARDAQLRAALERRRMEVLRRSREARQKALEKARADAAMARDEYDQYLRNEFVTKGSDGKGEGEELFIERVNNYDARAQAAAEEYNRWTMDNKQGLERLDAWEESQKNDNQNFNNQVSKLQGDAKYRQERYARVNSVRLANGQAPIVISQQRLEDGNLSDTEVVALMNPAEFTDENVEARADMERARTQLEDKRWVENQWTERRKRFEENNEIWVPDEDGKGGSFQPLMTEEGNGTVLIKDDGSVYVGGQRILGDRAAQIENQYAWFRDGDNKSRDQVLANIMVGDDRIFGDTSGWNIYDDSVLDQIRFVDPAYALDEDAAGPLSQHYAADLDGNAFTIDDYLYGDRMLVPDEDSLRVALNNQQAQPLTQAEVYFKIKSLAQSDPVRFKQYQKALYLGGFLSKPANAGETWNPSGIMDQETDVALQEAVGYGYNEAWRNGQTFDSWLYTQVDAGTQDQSGSGSGSGSGAANAWAVTDEVSLNMIVDTAGQSLLGRNLKPDERAQIVERIQAMENAEGQKTSGAIQTIDPTAQAENMIRELHPDAAKAHDVAGTFDMFADILGAGLGLAGGSSSFGSAPTGPNTLGG